MTTRKVLSLAAGSLLAVTALACTAEAGNHAWRNGAIGFGVGVLAAPLLYGNSGYYGGYGYNDGYYDALVAVAPAPGVYGYATGDESWLAYCSQRYRSFDPASGTFLGYDGYRHPCR